MKTYWDYTEKERSEMTEEFVNTLLDAELMTKGVLKVDPPKLREVPAMPEMNHVIWYEASGILFETAELAAAFLALKPHRESYCYEAGYDHKYAQVCEGEITTKKLYQHQDILNKAKTLAQIKEAKNANDKATGAFREASKAVDKVLGGVWEDWHNQQDTARHHKKVLSTLEDYRKTAQGDEKIALQFLRKVFTLEAINEAFTWLELDLPTIEESVQP